MMTTFPLEMFIRFSCFSLGIVAGVCLSIIWVDVHYLKDQKKELEKWKGASE